LSCPRPSERTGRRRSIRLWPPLLSQIQIVSRLLRLLSCRGLRKDGPSAVNPSLATTPFTNSNRKPRSCGFCLARGPQKEGPAAFALRTRCGLCLGLEPFCSASRPAKSEPRYAPTEVVRRGRNP